MVDSPAGSRGAAEIAFRSLGQFGGHWAIREKLGRAKAALLQGRASEAMKILALADEVIASQDCPSSLKHQAIVVRSKIHLIQKNPRQAIDELTQGFFASVKSELDYSHERAEATLLMGRVYSLDESKQGQEQAEMWFLRAATLHGRHADLAGEACDQPAALYEKAGMADRAGEWRARTHSRRRNPGL